MKKPSMFERFFSYIKIFPLNCFKINKTSDQLYKDNRKYLSTKKVDIIGTKIEKKLYLQ